MECALGRHKLLSATEEAELFRRLKAPDSSEHEKRAARDQYQAGDLEAREALVLGTMWLVRSVAKRCRGRLPYEDAVSYGTIGLLQAIEWWDPARGPLERYAVPCIRAKIARAREPWSQHTSSLVRLWEAAQQELSQQLGRSVNDEEVAQHVAAIPRARFPQLADDGQRQAELADLVRTYLTHLDDQHAFVIRLRYGLHGRPPMTLAQVAEQLGCSSQRVHQLERAAIEGLRLVAHREQRAEVDDGAA